MLRKLFGVVHAHSPKLKLNSLFFFNLRVTTGTTFSDFVVTVMFEDHENFSNRIQKTLYYGRYPKIDRPSLSLSMLSVDIFKKALPVDHLGSIDMHYAAQVGRDSCVSPCSMMLAMVYIERLRIKNPEYIQSTSSSELFLITMMIATKFLNDNGVQDEVYNDEWAHSGNMDIKDFNALERNFLAAVDWDIFVSHMKFAEILKIVESWIAVMEGKKRGWFSYTDMDVLLNNFSLSDNWKTIKETLFQVLNFVLYSINHGYLSTPCANGREHMLLYTGFAQSWKTWKRHGILLFIKMPGKGLVIAISSIAYAATAYILLCSTSLVLTGLSSRVYQIQNRSYQSTTKDLNISYSLDQIKSMNCDKSGECEVLDISTGEFVNEIILDHHRITEHLKVEEHIVLNIVNWTSVQNISMPITERNETERTTVHSKYCDQTWKSGFFTEKVAICA
ncbi:Protein CNPPD1 [Nymphon striatum]|nr:Protein CNPPD1 [Nymphon striatum]